MAVELPRCVTCRLTIQAGVNVTFRPDGRVQHRTCPPVICPVCCSEISPNTPIRRDGDALLHGNCWVRRARAMDRSPDGIAGIVMLIRTGLASGAMPRTSPTRVWGSMSEKWSQCVGCSERIVDEAEYELEFADGASMVLHRVCYGIWENERVRPSPPIRGGSAASPWTLFFDLRVARRAAHDRGALEELRAAWAEVIAASAAGCGRTAQTRARSAALRAMSRRIRSASALPASRG